MIDKLYDNNNIEKAHTDDIMRFALLLDRASKNQDYPTMIKEIKKQCLENHENLDILAVDEDPEIKEKAIEGLIEYYQKNNHYNAPLKTEVEKSQLLYDTMTNFFNSVDNKEE